MYSPYSFNYNITSIFYYRHIDNNSILAYDKQRGNCKNGETKEVGH